MLMDTDQKAFSLSKVLLYYPHEYDTPRDRNVNVANLLTLGERNDRHVRDKSPIQRGESSQFADAN